ncbi:hypothetical protein DICPUDRAFT_26513, partial [Dictyostelium purpureum]
IVGNKLVLVPYKRNHVEKYWGWMSSEEIREQTASDLLTLEEEYENQQSWYEDEHKITFIILDKDLLKDREWQSNQDDIESMVGDVNIFFNEYEDEGTGELEIMIAENSSRRKGLAKEALNIIMQYAIEKLSSKKYIVKIGEENQASIQMFKSMGFVQVGEVNVFKEVNLVLEFTDNVLLNLKQLNENLIYKQWE